ncbi:hypothetical protein FB45DRAFT_912929 [Roridomyces roridus]|uniref:YEATS domain-containing protein n=1 Tax=Roridomyces roridus TaxID=1738132 RepID=A0AAD7BXV7_9AGAR|nr:hypothetical protein FB45DRAFT_912929 [Roridomyces roridus]
MDLCTPSTAFGHIDKKPRLESESDSDTEPEADWNPDELYKQDIAADIALEIGLRQRLHDTIQSRIVWAQRLQECLMSDALDGPQTPNFKQVALDALAAIEAPCDVLFGRDEPLPPAQPSNAKKARKRPTTRAQLPKKTGKFLYIRLEGNPTPSILRCPGCMRTDFSSLQGLFNHARGTHSLGWTSHDECVRQCACTVEELQGGPIDYSDLDAGTEVGAGTGGVLPGLRTIFQQAVVDFEGATALNRTLGYHIDTPALASFLGREPVRRGVMVWDPDALVDVDGFGDESAKTPWHMPFSHRNISKDSTTKPLSPKPASSEVALPDIVIDGTPSAIPAAAGSRFHMATRIIVLDRSLWLPPDQRVGNDTHKWMISVDAPSYAHHITTVLRCLTVKFPGGCLSTIAPPFAVIGTAATAFLARLELSFSSASANGEPQKVVLEHWVELDRMQSPSVAQGEEQIVDVELERRTMFLPQQSGYIGANTRIIWDMDLEQHRTTPVVNNPVVEIPVTGSSRDERRTRNALPKVKILGGWPTVLKKLVERFPLTLRDVKGGKPPVPALPYKLAASPAQFSSLVIGRKKAIEWGRAMALRDAYNTALAEGLTEDVTTLTTADVFSWLHTNGYFPKSTVTLKQAQVIQTFRGGFCHVCGLSNRLHGVNSDPPQSVKPEARSSVGVADSFICHITPPELQTSRLPMVDIGQLFPLRPLPVTVPLLQPPELSGKVVTANWNSRAPALLATADPKLIDAVRELVSALKLSTFSSCTTASVPGFPSFPIDPTLPSTEIRSQLAPYAMLSLLIKPFVRGLVKTGLEAAARDRQRVMGQVDGRARRLPSVIELYNDRERMLTPSHILRGVVTGWKDEAGMATMGSLVRSGVPVAPRRLQPQAPVAVDLGAAAKKEPAADSSSTIIYT